MRITAGRPGLRAASITFLIGIVLVQRLPALPALIWNLPLVLLGVALLWRGGRGALAGWLLLGLAWAMLRGAMAMDARLPKALEGQDITAVGRLVDLPEIGRDASRFVFKVQSASLDGQIIALRGKVQVAWYDNAPPLLPCTRWQLRLRLKRPRGTVNPGGADSERSALQRRIVATGYVRNDPGNRRLGPVPWCVDGLRERLAQGIAARLGNAHDAALLRAFSVGDTRALSAEDWATARATGVSHLIAISGFHIGVAAAFGVWLVALIYLAMPRLALRMPRVQAQAAFALAAALAYGALAGMGLPTVRTLLMIAVVVCARGSRRHAGTGHSLALALLAMLLLDPLAVLSAGFWLSFVGVAFLVGCMDSSGRGLRGFIRELTVGQWVMTVALLPLTLWFFGQVSLVGALSNLVAVPVVSFAIVPLALLGMLALMMAPVAAQPVLWLASKLAHGQWWLLENMAAWPAAQQYLPTVSGGALVLAMLGALWLLAPRGVPSRWLGALLMLPLLLPPRPLVPARGFEAWVLDVGQGLAIVVRTRHHALVYDTGARYPSGFDLGAAVVVPSLHALGIGQLDLLMVSHGDNDHAGGARSVAAAFDPPRRLAGEPERMHLPMDACVAGQSWTWDGVRFAVLNPPANNARAGNDRSCVLLIEGGGDRLLLAGDISQRSEPAVASAVPPGAPLVLVVPHHGSKTSSSAAFIQALHPKLALVSAGWRNHFGHPRPEVVARYREAGVELLNTAQEGAVALQFPPAGPARVQRRERQDQARYWRE